MAFSIVNDAGKIIVAILFMLNLANFAQCQEQFNELSDSNETIYVNNNNNDEISFPFGDNLLSINELNKTLHQILFDAANLTNQWQHELLYTSTQFVSNLTEQLNESLDTNNTNSLVNLLYNTSRNSVETGATIITESIVRPSTFFVGQNLRLLGQGLWSLGHTLKHSGYHISNLEPIIQNASKSLSEYGMNLVNSSYDHSDNNQTMMLNTTILDN